MVTTIQLDEETRDKLKSFGSKGETYSQIINKLYSIAVKEQLREFLMTSKNTISLEEARKRHENKWQ